MASDACLNSRRAFLRGIVDVDGDDGESHGERRVGDGEEGSEGKGREVRVTVTVRDASRSLTCVSARSGSCSLR